MASPDNGLVAALMAPGGPALAPRDDDAERQALARMLMGQTAAPPTLEQRVAAEMGLLPLLAPDTEPLRPTGQRTSEGRPVVIGEDGQPSTERTITVMDPRVNQGAATNIPTLYTVPYRGRDVTLQMGEPQAVEMIARSGGVDPNTGRSMPGYASLNDALAAALVRTGSLGDDPGVRAAPITLEQRLQNELGLSPTMERATFLPAGFEAGSDKLEWAWPGAIYELAKALMLPGHAMQGGSYTPEDVTNMALDWGMVAVPAGAALAPKGAIGMAGGKMAKASDDVAGLAKSLIDDAPGRSSRSGVVADRGANGRSAPDPTPRQVPLTAEGSMSAQDFGPAVNGAVERLTAKFGQVPASKGALSKEGLPAFTRWYQSAGPKGFKAHVQGAAGDIYEQAAARIVGSGASPWQGLVNEITARGFDVMADAAQSTNSKYISVGGPWGGERLRIRLSDHSKSRGTGGMSRAHMAGQWELPNAGSKPDMASRIASVLRSLDEATAAARPAQPAPLSPLLRALIDRGDVI